MYHTLRAFEYICIRLEKNNLYSRPKTFPKLCSRSFEHFWTRNLLQQANKYGVNTWIINQYPFIKVYNVRKKKPLNYSKYYWNDYKELGFVSIVFWNYLYMMHSVSALDETIIFIQTSCCRGKSRGKTRGTNLEYLNDFFFGDVWNVVREIPYVPRFWWKDSK